MLLYYLVLQQAHRYYDPLRLPLAISITSLSLVYNTFSLYSFISVPIKGLLAAFSTDILQDTGLF